MDGVKGTPPVVEKWVPRFFTFWGGQAVSLVGSHLVQFGLVWWLTSSTGSATVLATASLVAVLPEIVMAPFIGPLVDRWNRKTIMIVADGGIALATLVLMVLFAAGIQNLWAVYAILLVRSAGGTFHFPAEYASTALMVPKEHLARIAGLNQALSGTLSIAAPPLGALLISILPMQALLAIDVVTAAIAISILAFIAIPQPLPRQADPAGRQKKASYWQDLWAGWKYILAWPGLLGIIFLAMAVNFVLRPTSSLIPLVVTQIHHGGAMQLGLVDSLFGAGIVLGGLLLSAWGGFKKRILTCLLGIAGMGLGNLIFGLTPAGWFPLAAGSLFLLGVVEALGNGPLDALLQAAVDPDMQGRVFSLLIAGARAVSPLSLLVAGPLTDWLGVRTWYLFGGCACILIAVACLFIPAIVNVEDGRAPQLAAAKAE